MTSHDRLLEVLDAFGGDVERLVADAALGAKIRQKNRAAGRCRRDRSADDIEFTSAVIGLRARGLSCPTIAERLLSAYGSESAGDPHTALTRRVERCLRRHRVEQRGSSPVLRTSPRLAP